MTADWRKYSTTAGSNTAAPPDGFPEGQAANTINNCMRDMAAMIKNLGDYTQGAWADISSTATCNIAAALFSSLRVLGTATINAFDNNAESGIWRILRFAGAAQLAYNATKMILPTAANITTAANDCAIAVSLGSGNWIVPFYMPAAGYAAAGSFQPLDAQLTAIAALTPAADKLQYWEGASTATLTDCTAFGRGLVSLADAAALTALTTNKKIVNYSWDASATATVTITGCGFTPRYADVILSYSTSKRFSIGKTDGTTSSCSHSDGTAGEFTANTNIIAMTQDSPGATESYVSFLSFTSGGMVVVRTKTGTPTGTGTLSVTYHP